MVRDEVVREHRVSTSAIAVQHLLHDALQKRDVSVDSHRQEQARNRSARAQQAEGLLRILEPDQPRFPQRVDADDLAPVARRLLQFRQHARMAGPRVLADDEDAVGVGKVLDFDRRLADADRFLQPEAARFVAHVRAIRQVVGAELSREQAVHERGFVAGAARRIERGFVRGDERIQLTRDDVERVLPRDGPVVIRTTRPKHRMRDAALLIVPEIAFLQACRKCRALAKNSGVARVLVASLAMAFAPFSQNSASLRSSSGSGQAQLGQSKPSFWLTFERVLRLRLTPMSRTPRCVVSQIDAKPPALTDRLPVLPS